MARFWAGVIVGGMVAVTFAIYTLEHFERRWGQSASLLVSGTAWMAMSLVPLLGFVAGTKLRSKVAFKVGLKDPLWPGLVVGGFAVAFGEAVTNAIHELFTLMAVAGAAVGLLAVRPNHLSAAPQDRLDSGDPDQ